MMNTFIETVNFFFVISAELILLFMLISMIVELILMYIPADKIQFLHTCRFHSCRSILWLVYSLQTLIKAGSATQEYQSFILCPGVVTLLNMPYTSGSSFTPSNSNGNVWFFSTCI